MPPNTLQDQAQRAFIHAVEARRRALGDDDGCKRTLMDQMLPLILSHLEQATSKYQVRSELPGRIGRLPVFRIQAVKRVALKLYEFLFREQRAAGLAQINAWQDFLQLYQSDLRQTNNLLQHVTETAQRGLDDLAAREREHHQQSQAAQHALEEARAQDRQMIQQLQLQVGRLEDDLKVLRSTVRLQAQSSSTHRTTDGSPSQISAAPGTTASEDSIASAERYVAFENHFRGPLDAVRMQFEQDYLPVLARFGVQPPAQVLDIGCGRGEWLALMRAHGFAGFGIDLNPVVCQLCQDQGLDVEQGDAIGFLQRQTPASFDLITGFHLIEHLTPGQFDALIECAHNVLRPGGLLILETPNPENFIVGSCNFYNDPTHQHPLPPEPTRFRLESQGFSKVDVLRLHPRGRVDPTALPAGIPVELIERLFIGQDYALVAQR